MVGGLFSGALLRGDVLNGLRSVISDQ